MTMYENVQHQFTKAADLMNLDEGVRKILSITNNEILVNFPVKMDDGRIETFTGSKAVFAITQRWISMLQEHLLRG